MAAKCATEAEGSRSFAVIFGSSSSSSPRHARPPPATSARRRRGSRGNTVARTARTPSSSRHGKGGRAAIGWGRPLPLTVHPGEGRGPDTLTPWLSFPFVIPGVAERRPGTGRRARARPEGRRVAAKLSRTSLSTPFAFAPLRRCPIPGLRGFASPPGMTKEKLNHPTTAGFPQPIQCPSRSRRAERALISGCVALPLGSVAWEGRKALRACCGGSGWSGSSRGSTTGGRPGAFIRRAGPRGWRGQTMPFGMWVPGSSSLEPRSRR
jgi:hypothetical protein